jgi:hypothetical protein
MRRIVFSLGVVAAIASTAVPVTGQDPVRAPMALTSLQLGQWEIRSRTDPTVNRSVCLGDPRALIQLRHTGATCKKYVISNDPRATTVHYSCPAGGHGQTTIRVETPRLIQLESQGVANRAPFSFTAEGRRIGNCSVAGVGGNLGN